MDDELIHYELSESIIGAAMHVLNALKPGDTRAYNLGIGKPFSVKDVVESVKRVSGREFEVRIGSRRAGDAAALYASGERARRELGWSPRFEHLDAIVETAWKWRERHPRGYASV